ncbi:MAG: CTD-interacting factor [Myxococcota bacterium]
MPIPSPNPATPVASPHLVRAYGVWRDAQRILTVTRAIFASWYWPVRRASVALENALMHTLLVDDVADPSALWPRVDGEACQVGFSCIGIDDEVRAEALARALVQARSESALTLPPAPPVVTDDAFSLGAFRLPRNAWVDRAWHYVAEREGFEAATDAVLMTALRYGALFAETRHIGPPPSVYDDFYAWGVRNEGFAQPFNARLLGKADARFFSACADVDAPFGSVGNFFTAARPDMPGAWCLDPPFLPETIRRVEEVIARWRAGEHAPSVLLIIPWDHPLSIQPDESVRLLSGKHVYEGLAGTQHPLPVDVAIHRFGSLDGFDAGSIVAGYTPQDA